MQEYDIEMRVVVNIRKQVTCDKEDLQGIIDRMREEVHNEDIKLGSMYASLGYTEVMIEGENGEVCL